MALLNLIETIQTKLSTLTKKDGQLIVVRDNASLYVDLDGSRIYISDWIDVSTDTERLSMLTPLSNKYYYVVETNKIWRYVSGNWVQVTLHNASDVMYDNTTSGLTATNVNGAIDEINETVVDVESKLSDTILPQYKRFNLSSAGWYRIAEFSGISTTDVGGALNNGCDIDIRKLFSSLPTENHAIKYRANNTDGGKFIDEVSSGLALNVTKIRFVYNTTTFKGYIEIYYTATAGNDMLVFLSNQLSVFANRKWELIEPLVTEETVDGFKVVTTHEFSQNKSYESEIEGLKTSKANIKNISYTDSSYAGNFPKAVQQAVTDGVLTAGTWSGQVIAGGSIGYYSGFVTSNGIASFFTHSYGSQFIDHTFLAGGTWTTDKLATRTSIETLSARLETANTNISKLKYEWTANIKCATWSRLCYVSNQHGLTGSTYLLNIKAGRDGLVRNDTFLVTIHHEKWGHIVKISGDNYGNGSDTGTGNYDIRIVVDLSGNGFFEINDYANSITSEKTQTIYCTLIPLGVGTVTSYTEYTNGETIDDGFGVADTMTVTSIDFQSDVTDAINSRLAYKDISSSIDVGDTGCTASGYVENGMVVIKIIIPAGTAGQSLLSIDSSYAPRFTINGNVGELSSMTDLIKIGGYINGVGLIYINYTASLAATSTITFTYPLKTS